MNPNRIIVVLSGEIACGKSTLAKNLHSNFQFLHLKSKNAIIEIASKVGHNDRTAMQRFGEKYDKETNGEWLVKHFQSKILESNRIVIDAVRIMSQIEAFRKAYGYQNVFHIHLTANDKTLEQRYFKRNKLNINEIPEINKYKNIKSNATEIKVRDLAKDADLVIETENIDADDNLIRAASFLRILPSTFIKTVDVIVGAQFGSEGKGQIAGYLAPNYDCLVRVGGPNAGHKVFEEPIADTFHIIPSGTRRAPNSKIIIGPGAVLSIDVILEEIAKYELEPNRLIIDENATIITNEDKKLENKNNIGSTKQGVGGATANNILKRLVSNDSHKAKFHNSLKQFIGSAHNEYEYLFSENKKILLEGTQGTFLSLHHGFYPFVTSRDTTVSGCIAESGLSPLRVRKVIMVTRRYPIRVQSPSNGTSGPFTRSEFKEFQCKHSAYYIPQS